MEVDRICESGSCFEEANTYCRMCSKHYCWQHPCMHLQAAMEDNSYTNRLAEDESDDDSAIRNDGVIHAEQISTSNIDNSRTSLLSNTLQPLGSYSQAQLTEQLDYHRTQARRIRAELERRALFATGVDPTNWNEKFLLQERKHKERKQLNKLPTKRRTSVGNKSLSQVSTILHNQVRLGNLSLENLQQILDRATKSQT